MVPDLIIYTTMISACRKGQRPEAALELFEAMKWQGIVPNEITYNAWISASTKD